MMNTNDFWALLDECRGDGTECEKGAQALQARLAAMPAEEIIAFQAELDARMIESYRWDLFAVAFIVAGGCTEEGFDYFRGWLLMQGQDFYETALMDAELAATGLEPGEVYECEDILEAPARAYQQAKGEPMPRKKLDRPQKGPLGKPWEEDDLPNLYPELYQKFS